MDAERIRGEQSVVADMPRRRMHGIERIIEDRDAHGLALDRAGVIAPLGALAPGLLVADAGAQDDPALARLLLAVGQAHRLGHADGHRTLLRVAEHDIPLSGLDCDFKIEQPLRVRTHINAEGAFISADHVAVRRDPFVGRADHARLRAAGHFQKVFVQNLPGLGCLGPEINPVDRTVREPERAVMLMIMLLALGGGLHRPVARHRQAAGAEQRIKVNVVRAFEDVFGEKLAVDLDADAVVGLRHLHRVLGGAGGGDGGEDEHDGGEQRKMLVGHGG